MSEPVDLVLFAHLVRKPDAELDLERAALVIAEAEYPGLDVADYVAKLDGYGAMARDRLRTLGLDRPDATQAERLQAVLDVMYRRLKFRGNVTDYYDPKNSFLNDVIDRRTGIPITLAVVLLAICRRAGVQAHGVSFPGHFLVRSPGRGGAPVFVDPFEGRPLEPEQLQALYEQATGDPGDMDDRYLQPASRRQILARMLNNLRNIYMASGDTRRLNLCLERIKVLEQAPGGRRTPSGIVH